MINPVVYHITLDICKIGSQKVLSVFRGDNKRIIVISLTENDKPYTITEGCTAKFTALKPDGNFIYNDCEIDIKNNTINYQVTDQTTAVNGIMSCQIRLIGANGGILSAPSFNMVVPDLLYNEESIIDSSSEFNALTRFLADLQHKLDNGEFDGKSIYIKGSVSDASELDAKIPTAIEGDGYLADNCHLYVFDGTAFKDMGEVRGPQGVSGVYVGSGDMPDGYNVQIDPDGAVFEMDTELNAESNNPVTNAAVTKGIDWLQKAMATATGEIGQRFAEHQTAIEGLDTIIWDNKTAIEGLPTKFAPSGFGLGTKCVWIDWNNATENGFYSGTANSPDGYSWYGYAIKAGDEYIVQHAFTVNTNNGFATHCVRVKNGDKWEPWEYENPPMAVGVEYRTTERFLGAPVYVQLFKAVAESSSINTNIGTGVVSNVVEFKGILEDGTSLGNYEVWDSSLSFNKNSNTINLGKVVPNYSYVYVTMKYTKA